MWVNAAACSLHGVYDVLGRVTNTDDSDAGAEVDEGVAVDINKDAAARRRDEHR